MRIAKCCFALDCTLVTSLIHAFLTTIPHATRVLSISIEQPEVLYMYSLSSLNIVYFPSG